MKTVDAHEIAKILDAIAYARAALMQVPDRVALDHRLAQAAGQLCWAHQALLRLALDDLQIRKAA